ncbi:MAG: tRNA (adenosine(37)-N6)-threonylcarbamoyltransferase complex ATPase subunit type 1 TsaE [Chloroflexota bacterium]
MKRSFTSHSLEQTQSLGEHLGQHIRLYFSQQDNCPNDSIVLALSGELGAGKTTLTQGIARGLGLTEPVTSPTFMLVREYELPPANSQYPLTFFHIDAYRLSDNPEVDAATFGLEEILETPCSIIVVEWAERIQTSFPVDRLEVQLAYLQLSAHDDSGLDDLFLSGARQLTIRAWGPVSEHLCHNLPIQL